MTSFDRLFKIISLSFLTFLVGCAIGPDFERPAMPLSENFRENAGEAGQSIVNLNWWEVYSDPILQELIREALANNKDLGIAAARVEQAMATMGITRADQFPTIGLNGQAQRSEASEKALAFLSTPINSFGLLGTLSWELDIWGKLRRATEAERASLLSTEFGFQAVHMTLISAVASSYFNILGAEQRLNISKGTIENRKGATKIIGERFQKGIIPELDLNQAQIEEATAAVALTVVERNLRQSENALSVLLGKAPTNIPRGKDLSQQPLPLNLPAGYPIQLLERRPDVRAAEEAAHAKVARIGVAKGKQLPSLNLAGFIGLQSLESNELLKGDARTWSIGGTLIGPLLDFGRSSSVIEAAEADAKASILSYEQTVLNAVREVEDALVAIRTSRDGYINREAQVSAARNAAKLSRARYDEGVSPYIEVLDVERSLFTAELGASTDRELFLVSIVNLYKALGGGWNPEVAN